MTVFLSYTFEDRDLADQIRQHLHDAGIETWTADNVVAPGQSIVETIASAIADADALIVLLSRASAKSQAVSEEIAFAVAASGGGAAKPMIPVVIERDVEIPLVLRDIKYLDLSQPRRYDERLTVLVDTIKSRPDTPEHLARRRETIREYLAAQRTAMDSEALYLVTKRAKAAVLIAVFMVGVLLLSVIGLLLAAILGGAPSTLFITVLPALTTLTAAIVGYYFAHRGSEVAVEEGAPKAKASQRKRE